MKYLLFLSVFLISIFNSSCSAIPIKDKVAVVKFSELPELLREKLKQNLNVSGRYKGPLILNLELQKIDFQHNQKMKGSFAGDHYFTIDKKKFVLNLNSGYNPFVLYNKKLYCLDKPMGSSSIKNLEKSMFSAYDLERYLNY